jgi:hypothetical protein
MAPKSLFLLLAAATCALAGPRYIVPRDMQTHGEVLEMRASTTVDPNAVSNVKCIDANT